MRLKDRGRALVAGGGGNLVFVASSLNALGTSLLIPNLSSSLVAQGGGSFLFKGN